MQEKTPHNQIYKQFFSDPIMVKELLFGFMKGDWLKDLDVSTLKRLNTSYVTENLRERESDIVWKVQWNGEWLYLLILIEFQSTVDDFMVVRVLSYLSLLYQDIIKEDKNIRKNMKLPPVLPIVLYNGDEPWDAPSSFSHFIPDNLPQALRQYQPDFSCWILDERRYIIGKEHEENIVASLISMECSLTNGEFLSILRRLMKMLQGSKFDGVRRAFTVYANRAARKDPDDPELQFKTLEEIVNMLGNNETLFTRMAAHAQREGELRGELKGELNGELKAVKRILTKRFGALTPEQELSLQDKSAEDLLEIIDRALELNSIDEIIKAKH